MNTPQSQSSLGNSQLDTTLGALRGGLPNAAGIAGENIAGWIKALQGNAPLADIAAELQNLHQVLRSGTADATTLAQSLGTLGKLTTKAAASATPDAQDKLRELGEVLSTAAGQLRG
ncbi:hypothetical protein MUN81_07655 [Hymenobacter sp. 5317J-9]|uniref:hypothetical protein n=1 Tax=Hymenobacter sp. 5317J-9 TaxID=2932250 RepID=UPI001FD6991A|nr:hypothetical protein [Hymenobacter sp. 5317J-9]UOQ99364.1 hypothetical protein MUN81_07655 [Hymenobacter sp. 5317J-9]